MNLPEGQLHTKASLQLAQGAIRSLVRRVIARQYEEPAKPRTNAAISSAAVTTPGTRSRFIDRAVRHLIETEGKMNLRERLKLEAIANAERDLAIAAEWFPPEQEAAQRNESGRETKRSRPRS